MPVSDETRKLKNKAKASLPLLLVAVISITTATYAWFTLSNSTSVQSMEVRVGTGTKLMVSTSDSGTSSDPWYGYVAALDNDMVNEALKDGHNYQLGDLRLWPLTSGNGYTLYTESGNADGSASPAASKYYLDLELWFRSSVDMDVYLNGSDSAADKEDGTLVSAKDTNNTAQKPVDHAVRVSFTAYDGNTVESHVIYEPNKDGPTRLKGHAKTDNGSSETQPTFDALGDNTGLSGSDVLFSLTAEEPKRVVLRIWIEGEDPQCVNGNGTGADSGTNLEQADLLAQFRFCGADRDGKFIENTVA